MTVKLSLADLGKLEKKVAVPHYRRRGGMQKLVATARTVADRTADVWIAFATEDAARGRESAWGWYSWNRPSR